MAQYGHMRELKEVKSLLPFIEQAAIRAQCTVRLIQPDGTTICQAFANGDPSCVANAKHVKIVIHCMRDETSTLPLEATCSCGKPLLILPIAKKDRIEGMLTACPFTEEKRPFLASVAGVISDNVVLARNAVHEWERHSTSLSVQTELYHKAGQLKDPEEICRGMLEVLLGHFSVDVTMFVPRSTNGAKWEQPIIQNNSALSGSWIYRLSSLVTTMYDEGRCPLIAGPENLSNYPELDEHGVSSFMSTTVSNEEKVFGFLIFCSKYADHILSVDDLSSLEGLKSYTNQCFYDFYAQKSRERNLLSVLPERAGQMLAIIDDIERNIGQVSISTYINLLKRELARCHVLCCLRWNWTFPD